jgi:hypothetical protein
MTFCLYPETTFSTFIRSNRTLKFHKQAGTECKAAWNDAPATAL